MTDITEADKMAFEEWWNEPGDFWSDIDLANQAWNAAIAHARGKQEPACFITKDALSDLRKHKDATTTVSSGRVRPHFGNPVPLYTAPPARNLELARLRVIEVAARAWWEGRTPRDSKEIALCAALAASPAPEGQVSAYMQGVADASDYARQGFMRQKNAPSKPKVKALVWEQGVYPRAHTPIGTYGAGINHFTFNGEWMADTPDHETAKAAAQSDYERRILSAIEGGKDDQT